MNELISIIVPVYNVENYIVECLESLINQSYDNLEIIVVDDESSDSSSEICDFYSQKDSRIKVFHKENGGVSKARNFGISKANGQWIMFLDSDDYLEHFAIERLIECSRRTGADIISSSYFNYYANKKTLIGNDNGGETHFNNDIDSFIHDMIVFPNKCIESYPTCLVPWGKIIKSELFLDDNMSFPLDLHPHEDALLNVQLFKKTEKQVYLHLPLLFYRQRHNASTKSKTKDNFKNNKIFCKYVAILKNSKGESLLSDEEYAVLCSKYFIYGMVNLWAFSRYNVFKAKEQLSKYMQDDLFGEAFSKIKNVELKNYDFSDRLSLSIDAARNKNIVLLLVYAILSHLRAIVKEKNVINGNRLFS